MTCSFENIQPVKTTMLHTKLHVIRKDFWVSVNSNILSLTYHLCDDQIKTLWAHTCAALFAWGAQRSLAGWTQQNPLLHHVSYCISHIQGSASITESVMQTGGPKNIPLVGAIVAWLHQGWGDVTFSVALGPLAVSDRNGFASQNSAQETVGVWYELQLLRTSNSSR